MNIQQNNVCPPEENNNMNVLIYIEMSFLYFIYINAILYNISLFVDQ